jgi:hypothetical protein
MTKTLHLYEQHWISLIDEAMQGDHRVMATAVLEPYTGDPEQTQGLGTYVGGHNHVLR